MMEGSNSTSTLSSVLGSLMSAFKFERSGYFSFWCSCFFLVSNINKLVWLPSAFLWHQVIAHIHSQLVFRDSVVRRSLDRQLPAPIECSTLAVVPRLLGLNSILIEASRSTWQRIFLKIPCFSSSVRGQWEGVLCGWWKETGGGNTRVEGCNSIRTGGTVRKVRFHSCRKRLNFFFFFTLLTQ